MERDWFLEPEEERREPGDEQEEEGFFVEGPEGEVPAGEEDSTAVFSEAEGEEEAFMTGVGPEGEEEFAEEEVEEGLFANRAFVFAVAGLVLFLLATLCMVGTYILFVRPRQQAAQATRIAAATQTAEAQAVLAAARTATAQAIAAALTATAQVTPTPTPTATYTPTPRPSPTPVIVLPTATPTDTPTPGLDLQALQLAATQTAQALTQQAALPTALPETGFGTDGDGSLWLWSGLALLLLGFIWVLRRLRALSA